MLIDQLTKYQITSPQFFYMKNAHAEMVKGIHSHILNLTCYFSRNTVGMSHLLLRFANMTFILSILVVLIFIFIVC